MTESDNNPLDPTLELTKTGEDQKYVYILTVDVKDRSIIDNPEMTYKEENDRVILTMDFALYPKWSPRKPRKIVYEITLNPEGLNGEIMVLIHEFNSPVLPGKNYGPMADGKAIIRFEKAKVEPKRLRKSAALEKAKL